MKKIFTTLLIVLSFSILTAQDSYKKVEDIGMTFQWKVVGQMLQIKLTAPSEGWVAVGFNPSRMMKDADYKMGYVDGSTVVLEDHFGTGNISHKLDTDIGGSDDFELIGGFEKDGSTTIEFRMPLNSGDEKDSILREGDDVKVLLAYSNRDSLTRKHRRRSSIMIKL